MARESLGVVGSLLALVAHDLRNPLSALHSNVGYLESTLASDDVDSREALSDIAASCSSLKHIIDNLELLGIAIQEGPPVLDRVPLLLWEVTFEALERLQPVAQSYGVQTRFEAARAGSPRVLAHREMFGRSLGNLLFNSIQNGGSAAPVSVTIEQDGALGVVRICDGGLAINEPLRQAAFSAEGQLVAKSDPRGRYGRGLGLYAAKVAAELSGAEVLSVARERGNQFELRAPLA